ncbi:MAG: Ig-like domain-containing protein, partial [Treponema sp.]|nr:Ig-like domain-containing protein [Treponema sp.]
MRSAVVKVPNVVGFRRFQAARGLNMPRFLALALLALFSTVFAVPELWAGGRRSVDTVTAEGEETWQNRFDVREYSRGTHNFIVHARDRAGNVSVSGPYNIVVDPNAALPVVRIVYPVENAIVRQDISVIGVASGRYGIERVLLSLNDDEDETVTNGTDYWDQVLDFSDLPDGRHTLHVRALDGGGLYGPVSSVSFILDRLPPAIELDSHAVGDIISGNVVIRGHATDASGIRRMYISYDGYDFRPLQTRVRRGAPEHEFSFPIRTKDFPDGSIVHHLRAVDNTGLVTVSPVMFFISNTPPTLEILSPLMYEHQYNSFMVSGRAHSTVGIARVYYQWGRGRGEIEVRPGDPYWHAILEQASGSGNTITVTAVDNAGNIVRASHRLDDRSRDMLPVLVIDYPPAYVLANMPANVAIYGRIETAAGFASVQVGTEMIDAFPSFRIDPDMIPIGRNMNLRLGPIADGGGRGAITTLRVTRLVDYYAPPVVPSRNLTVTSPALGAWVTGGSVSIEGSAARGARVEFRLAPWEDWQNLVLDEDGGFARSVSMAGREPGPVHLELRTGTDFPVYHPFTVAVAARESPRLRWVTPSLESDPELPPRLVRGNRTVIAELEYAVPIISVAVGHSLAAGQVDPDDPEAGDGFTEIPFFSCSGRTWFTYFSDFTTLTADDGTLVFRIKDATGSYFVTAPAYVMDPDPPIPILLVNSPTDNEVFTTDFELSGIAFDDVGIRGIYWRILGPTIESISPGEAGDFARAAAEAFAENPDVEFNLYLTERSFGIPIDFSMITDGEYIIEMFASDIYGVRSEVVSRTVRISTEPPYTRILYPLITHYNNRTIIVRGFSIDANGIDSVLFSMDGGNTWQDVLLEEDGHWEISLNTTLYTDGLNSALIQAVDGYGISSFTIAMINIDNSAPELHLTSPASGQNVGTDLEFMGRVADNMGLYSLTFQVISAENPEYRLDREITPESSVIFESMSLDGFAPGDYIVRVIARDLAGNETIISREITLGGGDAEIAIFNPFPGEVISGPVNVVGTVTGEYMPESVVLLMNGDRIADVPVDRFGTFSYDIPYELLRDGQAHGISVYFDLVTGERILSPVHTVFYYRFGPVLTIESHQDGDVITRRPWLSGRAWMSADDDWGEYYDR